MVKKLESTWLSIVEVLGRMGVINTKGIKTSEIPSMTAKGTYNPYESKTNTGLKFKAASGGRGGAFHVFADGKVYFSAEMYMKGKWLKDMDNQSSTKGKVMPHGLSASQALADPVKTARELASASGYKVRGISQAQAKPRKAKAESPKKNLAELEKRAAGFAPSETPSESVKESPSTN